MADGITSSTHRWEAQPPAPRPQPVSALLTAAAAPREQELTRRLEHGLTERLNRIRKQITPAGGATGEGIGKVLDIGA